MRGKCDAVPEGQGARAGQLILIILALVIPLLVGVRLLPSPWLHDGETSNAELAVSRARRVMTAAPNSGSEEQMLGAKQQVSVRGQSD